MGKTCLARAQKTIHEDIKIQEREEVAEYTKTADGVFERTRKRSRTHRELSINGGEAKPSDTVSEELPKKGEGEYDRLALESTKDGIYVVGDEHKKASFSTGIDVHLRYEVRFVEGNWEAFQRGEKVSFVLTEKGLADAKAQFEETLKKNFGSEKIEPLRKQFLDTLRSKGISVDEKNTDINVDLAFNDLNIPNEPQTISGDKWDASSTQSTTVDLRATITIKWQLLPKLGN